MKKLLFFILIAFMVSFSGKPFAILFQTSFEGSNPFQGLQDNQSCCSYSTTASTAFASDGTQSFRSEVRANDPAVSSGYRAELTGFPSSTGDMWYGFSIYFETPQSNGNWTGNSLGHFIQWHPNNSGGSASLSLWGGGKWDMAVNPSGGSSATHTPSNQQKTIRANEWYGVVMHVVWGSGGKAELWVNDTLIDSRTGLNWAGGEYLKLGMNRWNSNGGSPTTTWVIYYDDVTIGRDVAYADVDPFPGATPPPPGNQPPVANAGADVTLTLPNNSTALNGSGTDADGTIQSYAWTKVSGPAATLTSANAATAQLSELVQGTYVYKLTVTDDDGATGTDNVTITVNSSTPPGGNTGTASGVATFESIGIYWSGSGGNATTACTVKYRKVGDAVWKQGNFPWCDSRSSHGRPANEYRGSLVYLTPGTNYEIELSLPNGTKNTFTTQTWSETFPVGSTVTATNSSSTLNITTGGTANGYRLYDGSSATINVNNTADNCIYINAPYVIVRGFKLIGARIDGIKLGPQAHDVVIEKNDISGWGRTPSVDMDAGIRVNNQSSVSRIIIQCNKIHHPRSNATAWSAQGGNHPVGPQGITFEEAGSNHVIRYNEITSDINHYYNDGIGGAENFSYTGFPGANSDIYGNIVKYTRDDGIEAEGANMNVRIWSNFVDSVFLPYALASTSIGPVYVFRNVSNVVRRTSANGASADGEDRAPFIKAGTSAAQFRGGKMYVYNNTILQPVRSGFSFPVGAGGGILDWGGGPMVPVESRNNILQVHKTNWQSVGENEGGSGSTYNYDLYNALITASGTQEQNGIKNTPIYNTANPAGTYYLAPTSPGYDKGVVINNFTDGYTGTAPDMGAYEAGTPALKFGVQCTTAPPPTLPVRWLQLLKGIKNGNRVDLSWQTAEEIDFKKFIVERSADAQNWLPIGEVLGTGTNSVYRFTDDHPLTYDNYYRLKCVDIDQRFGFSNIVRVEFGFKLRWVSVTDIMGRVVIQPFWQTTPNIIQVFREKNLHRPYTYLVRYETGYVEKIVFIY